MLLDGIVDIVDWEKEVIDETVEEVVIVDGFKNVGL